MAGEKAKGGKKGRKHKRNEAKCKRYRLEKGGTRSGGRTSKKPLRKKGFKLQRCTEHVTCNGPWEPTNMSCGNRDCAADGLLPPRRWVGIDYGRAA